MVFNPGPNQYLKCLSWTNCFDFLRFMHSQSTNVLHICYLVSMCFIYASSMASKFAIVDSSSLEAK